MAVVLARVVIVPVVPLMAVAAIVVVVATGAAASITVVIVATGDVGVGGLVDRSSAGSGSSAKGESGCGQELDELHGEDLRLV